MDTAVKNQRIITKFSQDTFLLSWINGFLLDRKAQNMSKGTLTFYQKKLKLFIDYCNAQVITQITEMTPEIIRLYLVYLEEKGHNQGGVNAAFRTLRTFLFWWEQEVEPEGWSNPIRKAKPPKVHLELLEPVSLENISVIFETCDKTFNGLRDKAIPLGLLDTGARADEFLGMKLDDLNLVTGQIIIREGKGGKFRIVFLGKTSLRAVRAYLKTRTDISNSL